MNNTKSAEENKLVEQESEPSITADGENASRSKQTEENAADNPNDRPSWPVAIACAIFIALPAGIPLYFGFTVDRLATRIIFISMGVLVVIVNILTVLYVFRRIGPGSQGEA